MTDEEFQAGVEAEGLRLAEAQYEAKIACEHANVTRLPGVTSTGVKISTCNDCGASLEEDFTK